MNIEVLILPDNLKASKDTTHLLVSVPCFLASVHKAHSLQAQPLSKFDPSSKKQVYSRVANKDSLSDS